jgi:hypothetical protein
MYNRFESSLYQKEKLNDKLMALKNHTSSLNDYAKLLEKVINYYFY